MDLSGRINEELLICQICYGRFTQHDRQPKLLACSHTFCADCISQYLRKRKKSKHKFPCPLCRKETNLGKDGVHGLSNNLTVMGLMDILDRLAENEEEFKRGGPRGGSVRPSSKSPKHRPALRQAAWLSPEMPRDGTERSRAVTRTAPSMQCDNCQATATDSLICGHVFCDHCVKKCGDGDCIQCSMVGVGARSRKSATDRPPPMNPMYDDSSPDSPTAPFKPAVPVRSSPVKPISLSSASRLHTCSSAPALNQGTRQGAPTRHQTRPDTLPSVEERDISQSPERSSDSSSSPEHSSQSRDSHPHIVHLSSTLPANNAFGMALRSQMMLPRSTSSTHSLPEMEHTSPQRRIITPPQPPPRRISNDSTALASPLRCLAKFGHFSPIRLQTNAFHQPTHIAASQITNDWAVVDSVNMTLQIFDQHGGYISMFKVLGIKCACFLSADRLAVSSHRGVEIYQVDGTKIRDLLIGRTDAVVSYKHSGFLAVQPRSIHFYSPTFSEYRVISRKSHGKLRRSTSFQHITAVTVTTNGDIVVLDSKLGDITVIDSAGKINLVVEPSREPCGKLLAPEAIAVDCIGNIIVSDTGNRRLLRFSANGMFSRCLLNFSLGTGRGDMTVHGVAVGEGGAMAVVLAGSNMAEVRVYQLV